MDLKFKPLNLRSAKKSIQDLFRGWLTFTFEKEGDCLTCKASLTAQSYDDEIFTVIQLYKGGFGAVTFHFDFLEQNARTLELVNAFNDNVPYLKAFIQENNCLAISHSIEYCTKDTAAQNVKRAFDDLVNEGTKKYLLPLTEITRPKE